MKVVSGYSLSIKHPERLYKIVNESKYDLYLVQGSVFATNIYVNEREWNFMFFLTHTDLNLIKLFIKKWVDDMKMKKKT